MHIICKNCEHHFKGNFCPNCGQSSKIEPITAKYFLHDIPHSIFHVDKGFLYTLKALIIQPAKSLKAYLAGKRVNHFRPFAFVIILSTITALLTQLTEYLINLKFTKANPGEYLDLDAHFFQKYISVLIFILIPILAFFTWLFFRKRGYNYWEHFLINTYAAAYLNIFLCVLYLYRVLKYYIWDDRSLNFTIFMFFFMAYYGHVFGGLMRNEKWPLSKNIAYLALLNFFLATVYMTAFSVTGIMTPWWGE